MLVELIAGILSLICAKVVYTLVISAIAKWGLMGTAVAVA